jgi:regulator of nucleoside diphosphate kinase
VKSRIVITRSDEERLERMLEVHRGARDAALVEQLEAELADAEVVGARSIPSNVVTMDSVVTYEDAENGRRSLVKLVYPPDARLGEGKLSVLAPIGAALLGLSVGQSIEWPLPTGRRKRIRVVAVSNQPEAAGDERAQGGEA